jgi:nicotinate-nucleotide--dimethylbenzimidazole phosphoribosyltransferase
MTWATVPPLDAAAADESSRRRELLGPGAIGALGDVVDRIAAIRGTVDLALAIHRPVLVVFAADHGVASAMEISAYPASETARRISDLAAGVGPIAPLAQAAGVVVRTVDIAVAGDLSATPVDRAHRVRSGSGRIDREDALSEDEVQRCFDGGRAMADAEVDGGADLLIGAVCGVGVSAPTAALVSAVTGMEPVDATTRGSGIGDAAWITKAAAVRDARFRARAATGDARTLLRVAGGPDLAALTGFIAQAAARRTPVLVDDVPTALCGLLANRLAPGTDAYLVAVDSGIDRTAARLHQMLGLTPLTDWRLGLGMGAASVLSVPAIRAAADLVREPPHPALRRTVAAIPSWDADLL